MKAYARSSISDEFRATLEMYGVTHSEFFALLDVSGDLSLEIRLKRTEIPADTFKEMMIRLNTIHHLHFEHHLPLVQPLRGGDVPQDEVFKKYSVTQKEYDQILKCVMRRDWITVTGLKRTPVSDNDMNKILSRAWEVLNPPKDGTPITPDQLEEERSAHFLEEECRDYSIDYKTILHENWRLSFRRTLNALSLTRGEIEDLMELSSLGNYGDGCPEKLSLTYEYLKEFAAEQCDIQQLICYVEGTETWDGKPDPMSSGESSLSADEVVSMIE